MRFINDKSYFVRLKKRISQMIKINMQCIYTHTYANYVKLVELSAEKKTISRKAAKIDKELKRANQSINHCTVFLLGFIILI